MLSITSLVCHVQREERAYGNKIPIDRCINFYSLKIIEQKMESFMENLVADSVFI